MTTFDELFAEHNLTPNERKALVMHLATLRAQKTVEALQDCPLASAPSTPPHAVMSQAADLLAESMMLADADRVRAGALVVEAHNLLAGTHAVVEAVQTKKGGASE